MTWTHFLDDALGVYEKRDVPGGAFECRGSVKVMLGTNRVLFVPHDRNLKPVECDLDGIIWEKDSSGVA